MFVLFNVRTAIQTAWYIEYVHLKAMQGHVNLAPSQ